MKLLFKKLSLLALSGWLIGLIICPRAAEAASAVFGGGPFYSGGTSVMNTLRGSGFTTVILWCIHVDSATGNLIFNDQLVVANGAYVGNAAWPGQLATLKAAPTSVNRIEVSVGSWGVNDFQSIQTLMNSQGTGTNSILYRNFKALKTATGADAVDFDDEMLYDVTTTVRFGQMLSSLGYKVTLCPYTNPGFWQNVYSQLRSVVDVVYLQCYAGGAGNDPSSWSSYFGGLKVSPGMWCVHGTGCVQGDNPASVAATMSAWRSSADIPGGFMWLYDDMLSCSGQGRPADYATAINQAVDSLGISPLAGFSAVVASHTQSLPASTPFLLTNTGNSTLNWRLFNTIPWLNVSATNGSVPARGSATVIVSLKPGTATNLPAGQYSANIWFTNLNTGVSRSRSFTLNTAVTNWPLALSGFNAALMAPSTATPAAPGATAFDIPNNYCFYQAGLSGSTRGLPWNGSFSSLCDKGTAFQLGLYGGTNALLLGDTRPKSGTLTLSRPQAFNSLAVLACSANGGGLGTLVLNFADGTKSQPLSFNAQDWFYTVTNVALQGFGRLKLGASFTFEDNGASNPNLYQTTLNLDPLGINKPLAAITFSIPANAGAQQTTAILGVSGSVRPVPMLAAILDTNGTVRVGWLGSGTLLQSTNLSGPWLTNGANSPATIVPTGPGMFYRLQAQ